MPRHNFGHLVGARGTYARTVTPDLTADAIGNSGVQMLATAWIVAFAEAAAYAGVRPLLPPEYVCVGIRFDLHHRAPARVGLETETTATVTAVDGKRIAFRFAVRAGERLLAGGTGEWGIVPGRRAGGPG